MRYFILLLVFFVTDNPTAQTQYPFCGTDFEANMIIRQRMFDNREKFKDIALTRNKAIKYVPVNYHLVAKSDSTGRLPIRFVLENLCAINKLFEPQEFVFYLRTINFINNNEIFNNPSSTLGSARIRLAMNTHRNAVNIFVASVANADKPGVLAFYSPNDDYIVADDNYVNSNGTTVAHEIGHFFSLAHTFFGWEETDYNILTNQCLTPTPTSIGPFNTLVEYVSRTKTGSGGKLHCQQAADGFCDTPPDYNLGFGWPNGNCRYDKCAKDPDGVSVNPDEQNMMSYFLSCLSTFTPEQQAAILLDYQSSKRNYLRTVNYSPKPMISEQVNYIAPERGSTTADFRQVKLEWAPVPFADQYIFELGEVPSFSLGFRTALIRKTDTTIANLLPNKVYYWRVIPFNSNSLCPVYNLTNFRTPTQVSTVNHSLTKYVTIDYQNSESGVRFLLNSKKYFHALLAVMNAMGQVVSQVSQTVREGENTFEMTLPSRGAYFYILSDDAGNTTSGKLLKL